MHSKSISYPNKKIHIWCYSNIVGGAHMEMRVLKEKRKYQRLALNRLVRVKEESGNTMQVIGINYSSGGMALNSKVPMPLGEFIELQFRLDEYENQKLQLVAEVVQNFKQKNVYITGVRFVGELSYYVGLD